MSIFQRGVALTSLVLLSTTALGAQEFLIKDNISGLAEGATNSLNNQTAGAGGRQILLTQHVITQQTEITRFLQLSSSTAMPVANGFSYSVRSLTTPFVELFSGAATRISRTTYTDVTLSSNPTNLDEFAISGLILDPGTYYFTVHASDGNAYQVAAHSASAGGVEPLLAENGGVPFLAGANFHLYTQLFGILPVVPFDLDGEADLARDALPAAVDITLVTAEGALRPIARRLSDLRTAAQAPGIVSRAANPAAFEPTPRPVQIWADADAEALVQEARPDLIGYDSTSVTGTFGVDYAISPSLVVGAAYGRSTTESTLDTALGEIDLEGNHLSLYLHYAGLSGLYAQALYSYGAFDLETERSTAMAGTATGDTDADLQILQAEIGYRLPISGPLSADIHGGIQYATIDIDGYTETATDASALTVGAVSAESLNLSAGVDIRYDAGRLQPYAGFALERMDLDFDDVLLALVANPGTVDATDLAASQRGLATFDLGFGYAISDNVSFTADYSIDVTDEGVEAQSASLGIFFAL